MEYPSDFIWGAASSAYQIEGAYKEDGKGLSIWDTFSHQPGTTFGNHTGDVACDHYHLFKKDIALMKGLGITNYRFSVSWPRIFPNGDNVLNARGLAFYDALVNELVKNDITPFMTLYHWDLPQALSDCGGWLNRDNTDAFAEFAGFVAKHFSDRVTNYFTINEPQCIAYLGYSTGTHAPGLKLSDAEVMKVFHHLSLAHGKAVLSMRKMASQPIRIGYASTGMVCYPQTESAEDIALAEKLTFSMPAEGEESWGFVHQIMGDPVFLGHYTDLSDRFPDMDFSFRQEGDLAIINQPVDYLGINVYNGHKVSCEEPNGYVPKYPGFPRTAMKWPITPGVMNWGLHCIGNHYHTPVIVSENGLSCNDKIFQDGRVHDPDRIDFLSRYLNEMEKGIEKGSPVIGYFHWALTDNFEWYDGYNEHFGLVYVDFRTQERIVKDSGYWYRDYISLASNSSSD